MQEPQWQPISELGTFVAFVDRLTADAHRQAHTLEYARGKPLSPHDGATVMQIADELDEVARVRQGLANQLAHWRGLDLDPDTQRQLDAAEAKLPRLDAAVGRVTDQVQKLRRQFNQQPAGGDLTVGGDPWRDPGWEVTPSWMIKAQFNPAAWIDPDSGELHVLFRAEGQLAAAAPVTSQIGWVTFPDPGEPDAGYIPTPGDSPPGARLHPVPVLAPDPPYQHRSGLEDPRVAVIDGELVVLLTVHDGQTARLALSRGLDPLHLSGPRLVFDDDQWVAPPGRPDVPRGWTKSGVLIPQPIDGHWWLLFGDTCVFAAHTDREDLTGWTVVPQPVLTPRAGMWDAELVEPGPTPLLTPDGIWLVYNAARQTPAGRRYAVGTVLLSASDPTVVLRRTARPMLDAADPDQEPTPGRVRGVLFVTGLIVHGEKVKLFYGEEDTRVCHMTVPASWFLHDRPERWA